MAKIFIKLDDIFAKVSPHKSLVLAFDGPAPYAKVQTQRKRRKTHPECSLITPGTEFMNSMESVMICYILQRYRKHRLSNVAVFISDGTCPGEGELKIIDWIQHHMPRPISELSTADSILKQSFVQNNLLSSRDSVLICGSDSDILVQSICMGAVNPNTMVLQLTADGPDALCNISSLIVGLVHAAGVNWKELADYQVMATNNNNDGYPVEERLVVSEPASPTLPADTSARPEKQQQFHPILQLRSLHVDLAVLFALQGNDYLPKMRCISNQRALLAYSQAMRELPVAQRYLVDLQRNTFNFVALWALMKKLDEITNGMRMILPVVVPDAMAALHSALQKRAAKRTVRTAGSVAAPQGHSATKGITEAIDELTWNVTLVSGPAIRCLTTSNNEVEYFAELPVGAAVSPDDSSESATVRYFFANESASGVAYEAPQFDFTGLTLWRCSMHLNGVTYASLKLFASKRMARRHCAEMVLREIDEVHYLSYVQQRNAGKEALRRMKMTAAAERAGLDMAFGLEHAPTAGASSASEQEPEPDAQKRTCEDDPPRESIEESEKEKEVEMMTETGDVVDEEELNSTSEVSAQEYLAYLRDSDIEEFLRGVLWMVHMYAQGECSDQGYTYSSRPPLTALAIRRYIERAAERGARSTDGCSGNSGADTTTTTAAAGSSSSAARDADDNPLPSKAASSTQISAFQHLVTEQQRHLAARVSVPFSDSKSLSADAASLCVLPEEGVSFLPPRLREPWRWMAAKFYSQLEEGNLCTTSYEDLVSSLEECFLAHRLEGGVISSPNAAPPPASARRNTDLTEELSQPAQTPDTQQSANSKATRNVTSSAESKDDSEGSSGGSAKNKLKGKKHSGRRGIQSWVSTSMVLPLPQLHKDSSDDDIATTPPLGAADRACAQLGANLYGTLDSVLVSTPHNSWTILSNPAVLKGRGYLGQYKTKRVNLPLPLTFRTPSKLPPGSEFLRSESERSAQWKD